MFELDIFFSDNDKDAFFGRRWSVLPEIGDSIAITDDEGTEWVGHVEHRVFVSAGHDRVDHSAERLRVQLHVALVDLPRIPRPEEAAA